MSDQRIIYSPEQNQWTLTDGRHHMEVPRWAREIMRSEFERETRPLQAEADKLREENERLIIKLNAEHIVRQNVEAENAKLRELVVRMFHTIEWSDRMSDSMYWPSFSYERELRELGLEVDDGSE